MVLPPSLASADDESTNASGDEQASESASSRGDEQASESASSSSSEPAIRRAPCRAAARYQVRCPDCRVSMQISHLQYRHVCKRSADPRARAAEMQEQARKRFRERTLAAAGELPNS